MSRRSRVVSTDDELPTQDTNPGSSVSGMRLLYRDIEGYRMQAGRQAGRQCDVNGCQALDLWGWRRGRQPAGTTHVVALGRRCGQPLTCFLMATKSSSLAWLPSLAKAAFSLTECVLRRHINSDHR
jgi:hypothetical protein